MRLTAAGDLARSFALNQAYANTKSRLERLTYEMSSGRHADVPAALGGDTRRLAGVEHRLTMLDTYARNTAEAEGRFGAMQQALGGIQAISDTLGPRLLSATALIGEGELDSLLVGAEGDLEAAVTWLNTDLAGQFVFSGSRTQAPAVVDKDTLLSQIEPLLTGLADPADVVAAVSNFFDAPAGGGGYLDLSLTGATDGSGPVALAPGQSLGSDLTAATPALREMLKGLTLAALAQRGALPGDRHGRLELARSAGAAIVAAHDGVIRERSSLGVLQERIEQAQTRNAADRSTLEMARGAMVGADPYVTAAALTESQVQLETLYSITARLSRMSLADRL